MGFIDGCAIFLGLLGLTSIICNVIGYYFDVPPGMVFSYLIVLIPVMYGLYKLCLYIFHKVVGLRKKNKLERLVSIKEKYPLAYNKYVSKYKMRFVNTQSNRSLSSIEKRWIKIISTREDFLWEQEERIYKEELEREKKKREETRKKAEWIKNEYPEGYEKWSKIPQKFPIIITEPINIVKEEGKIAALDKQIKSEKWEKAQSDFSDTCYELSEKHLPDYGRYEYDIPFTKFDVNGKEIPGTYKVWQLSYSSMCLRALDYTNCPRYKKNAEKVPEFENGTRHFEPHVYKEIAEFIKEIADHCCKDIDDCISVTFNYEKDWDEEVLDSLYDPLENLLSDYNNIYCDDTFLYEYYHCMDEFENINVIVDIVTENDDMKRLCQKFVSLNRNFRPVIVYISLMKAYDRDEMIEIIEEETERQAKIKEEKEKENKAKKSLKEGVSQWDTLFGGLKYTYLFYYYPNNSEIVATQEDWNNRWIVWNFKNDPARISSSAHANTLNKVIPMIKNKLLSTFSEESLKYLTLVCIPASSQAKTEARYEEFSSKICEELGMINAYPHIKVTEERMERHLGGTSTDTDKLSFDNAFFKGKYVLLFDDVITRGDSMNTFKRKMESLGATVVGGLCLGRTKHERDIPSPIESTKPDMAFPPRFESTKPDEIIRPPFDLLF